MSVDMEKIAAWGEWLMSIIAAGRMSLDVQDVFSDDESILKSVYTITDAISKSQEKALKILARLMHGKNANIFTLDEVFDDYVSNYHQSDKAVEIVKDHALEMHNLLFDVVNALDGQEEHAELLGEIRRVIDAIDDEEFSRRHV